MRSYSLSKEAFAPVRRRLILAGAAATVLGLVGLAAVGPLRNVHSWWSGLAIALGVVGFVAFQLWRMIRQQREIWDSVRIELGEDYIARSQIRVPEIRIQRGEITEIRETRQGLAVLTADKYRSMLVPAQLHRDELGAIRAALSEWAPIQPESSRTRLASVAVLAATVTALALIFVAHSAWVVLAAGIGLIALFTYLLVLLHRDRGVDPRFRRSMIGTLLFIALISAVRFITLLLIPGA